MSNLLEGKVAVVTGSGQGVGKGIALVLAREGAKVVTNNRTPGKARIEARVKDNNTFTAADRERILALAGDAESAAAEIVGAGGEAVPFYGDVADYETAGKLIQKAIDAFGRIDILVNNAASPKFGLLVDTSEKDWDLITGAKLKGSFNTMRHAVPFMIKQKFGRIVNVASDAWQGLGALDAYSAGNAGLVGLTKAASKELYQYGVTANVICPLARSPNHSIEMVQLVNMLKAKGGTLQLDGPQFRESEAAHGPAEDMAPFVAYLCTEKAAYISGAVFTVTANGKVELFSEPAHIKTIKKDGAPWTMEELVVAVPNKLLKDYVTIAKQTESL